MSADRYAVIGHPISHSRSPFIHGEFAKATRQDMSYERFDIAPEELSTRVPTLLREGFRGLNITVPHKESVVALTDELTERAQLAGAVNTLIALPDGRVRGDNTDGAGLMADLHHLGIVVTTRSVLILGAGGATRGILGPLLAQNPSKVVIANRTLAKAEALVKLFGKAALRTDGSSIPLAAHSTDDLHEPFDVVIHATSLGLQNATPLVDPKIIGPSTDVYDLGYGHHGTVFTRWAIEQAAASSHDGMGMLVEQAAEAFWLWRGVRPETTDVRRLLAEHGDQSGERNKP
ncbi:MAG: shikimate 5-dehydrogenase [Pseudomonadota bacterium]